MEMYIKMCRGALDCHSDLRDIVQSAATHISQAGGSPLAWVIEWDAFRKAGQVDTVPLLAYSTAAAWVDAVTDAMERTC